MFFEISKNYNNIFKNSIQIGTYIVPFDDRLGNT